jgi:hypothetical protein
MPRLNVRCCCQPQKILGTLEVSSLERNQIIRMFNLGSASVLEYYCGESCEISAPRVSTHIIKIREFKNGPWSEPEYAVYSDDRPIEFWRQFLSFQEAPSETADLPLSFE